MEWLLGYSEQYRSQIRQGPFFAALSRADQPNDLQWVHQLIHQSREFTQAPVRGEVSCLDVALWLNWKLTLDSVSGPREAGLDRREEWTIQRCRDGYVAVIFLDKDIPHLAKLVRSTRLLDTDFSTGPRRRTHLAELHAIVADALADRSRDEIMREAEELRLPFAPVLSPDEVVNDPQMRARDFFRDDGSSLRPSVPVMWDGIRPDARMPSPRCSSREACLPQGV